MSLGFAKIIQPDPHIHGKQCLTANYYLHYSYCYSFREDFSRYILAFLYILAWQTSGFFEFLNCDSSLVLADLQIALKQRGQCGRQPGRNPLEPFLGLECCVLTYIILCAHHNHRRRLTGKVCFLLFQLL